jgi:hypothetical protein
LSKDNTLAAGKRWRKRTDVYGCIAGEKSIPQTIDCADQLATQQLQFYPLLSWAV